MVALIHCAVDQIADVVIDCGGYGVWVGAYSKSLIEEQALLLNSRTARQHLHSAHVHVK